jgi:hypothetical protein
MELSIKNDKMLLQIIQNPNAKENADDIEHRLVADMIKFQ